MLPENSLQLMKGFWERPEVIIVILIIVFADVIWPIIKKRRKKQQAAQLPPEPVPEPVPAPEPDQSSRRERRAAQLFEAVQSVPAAAPRAAPPRKPSPPTVQTGLTAMVGELFAPLAKYPQLSRAVRLKELSGRLNQAVQHESFPLSLADAAISVSQVFVSRVPGYRAELIQAAGVAGGSVEISSLDDLVNNPDALAIGCLDVLIADVVGLTILGPAFAAARLRALTDSGRGNAMHLNLAGGGAVALAPPASVLLPVYAEALRSLGYARALPRFRERMGYVPDEPEFTLAIGGLGRKVTLPVKTEPAQRALSDVLDRLATTRLDVLEGRGFDDISRSLDLPARYDKASREREKLRRGEAGMESDAGILLAVMDIAVDHGLTAGRDALAAAAGPRRRSPGRKAAAPERGGLLPTTRGAIVEGLVLAEVLARKNRPTV